MRFFGPLSSLFDLATFAFLYFILCPALLGDNFTELSSAIAESICNSIPYRMVLESMWTQVLILHLLRTKQLSILRSRASGLYAGHLCRAFDPYCDCLYPSGPPARPGSPSALVFWISGGHHSGYMLLVTAAKRWYIQKYHTLL
mgnify:CR=1 FL=1